MVGDRQYVSIRSPIGTHGRAIELAHPKPHVPQTEGLQIGEHRFEHFVCGRRAAIVVMTLFHSIASFVMADVLELVWSLLPLLLFLLSLVCVAPKYLNFFRPFSIHPYFGRWSWLDTADENFALLELISMAYPVAVFLHSLSVSCWISSSLAPRDRCFQQTASFKAVVLWWMLAEVSKPSALSFSRNILNNTGDNRQPCRIPIVILNKSLTLPFGNTALIVLLYCTVTWLVTPINCVVFFKIRQMPLWQTRSNAFLKSIKLWKSFWCSKCFSTNSLNSPVIWNLLFPPYDLFHLAF